MAVVLVLSACTTGGGKPAWVAGSAKSYPPGSYMTATGSGDKPEKAKDRALANLAKIFEVQIDESSHDETTAWTENRDGESRRGHGQLAVRYLDAYTGKLLEGAEVVETWYDNSVGLYYALAVLDRQPLIRRLSEDIRKNDRFTQTLVAQAGVTTDAYKSACLLYQARMAQFHREALQRDLRIVDQAGVGIRPLWTVKQLDNEIDRQMQRMKVSTAVSRDPVGELQTYLQAGIASAGMSHGEDNAEYQLRGDLDVKDVGKVDDWYWFQGSLEISLRHSGRDEMLVTERWPVKAAGATREQAQARLRDQLQQRLALELKAALLGVEKQSK